MTTPRTTKIIPCPGCGHPFNAHFGPTKRLIDGFFSGCPQCGYLFVSKDGGGIRSLLRSEWPLVNKHPTSDEARKHVRDEVEKRYWG